MPEIELSGGFYDGQRFQVPELTWNIYMPVRVEIALSDYGQDDGLPPPMPPEPMRYERAGIRDDGTPWYRLR